MNKVFFTLLHTQKGQRLAWELPDQRLFRARNKKRGLCCPRHIADVPGVETLL
ncbi:MAG: hypothetical protein HC804_13775 [Anaerolineae bacterium]|nr:hypothetical protein [Anaerolineae bacterium]